MAEPRRLGPADASACAAVHAAAFAEPWPQLGLAAFLGDPAVLGLGLDAEGADQNGADPNGAGPDHAGLDPVGPDGLGLAAFVLLRQAAGEAEVLTLAVRPERRRRGLARRLLAAGLERLGGAGVRQLFLEVAVDNAPALALYRGHGFACVGRRRGYYRGGDALVLRLGLAAGDA